MAAGLGFKDFTTGEVLTAADVDGYLMQGVWVFASAAARDAAVTSPQEGNFAYLKDTNVTTYYTGSAWANLDTTGMTNPMTTTGDTIYSSSGSTPARLGIGTAGQVLTVNSGATAPEWKTPSSGSGLTLVKTQTIGSAVSSITVSSAFSSTYDNYLITISGGVVSTNANLNCQLGSTTSGYYMNGYYMQPTSTTVGGDALNGTTSFKYCASGDTTSIGGHFTLMAPNLAKPTLFVADAWRGSSNRTYSNYRGSLDDTTQYTEFTLIVDSSGTATGGTIRVYGYTNS
jgi:hypothetical protein